MVYEVSINKLEYVDNKKLHHGGISVHRRREGIWSDKRRSRESVEQWTKKK